MSHSAVAAGLLPAQRTVIAAATQATRKGGAEALSGVGAAERIERRDQAQFGRRVSDADDSAVRAEGGRARDAYSRPDRRQGAPSSPFLAQHIAQEVEPEDPGFSAFQAGARAYVMRRDSTVEILSASGGLDIYV